MKRILLTVMLLAGPYAHAQQTHYWGYSTMQYSRTSGESLNTGSKHHGVAIRLSAGKAAALKGARIVGIRTAFSTSLLESLHFFVSRTPGSADLAQSDGAKASLSLKDYMLNTPVEIDGSELYVGYEAVCKDDLRKPVLFDHASALPAGTIYAYTDAGWTDASASGYGAPVLQLVLENLPSSYSSDILLKSIGNQAYNLQQGTYSIQGELFNCGTTFSPPTSSPAWAMGSRSPRMWRDWTSPPTPPPPSRPTGNWLTRKATFPSVSASASSTGALMPMPPTTPLPPASGCNSPRRNWASS